MDMLSASLKLLFKLECTEFLIVLESPLVFIFVFIEALLLLLGDKPALLVIVLCKTVPPFLELRVKLVFTILVL